MASFVIHGGNPLRGEHTVQGAKNSALPILAAAVATKSKCVVHRCPMLSDVTATLQILRHLGCRVTQTNGCVEVDASTLTSAEIPMCLMREMRSSIIFMGPLLCAVGEATLCAPGGCEIGLRPIDMHVDALCALGVQIDEQNGLLRCTVPNGLIGARIALQFASVGATENAMIAATAARGVTVISNAAREPEIADLARFLNRCGARIHGAGEGVIVVEGVKTLHGAEHTVIPDRIAAMTLLCAAAVTKGEILLRGAAQDHMDAMRNLLERIGCTLRQFPNGDLALKLKRRLDSFPSIHTAPYPGFPTDAQAAAMVLASLANGTAIIKETIFENRFRHVSELRRMGARIRVEERVAVVEGVEKLHGAHVDACDLRAGSALVLAGLAAEGTTVVNNIWHIDRGCEQFEITLKQLGADIKREEV
ncbi:MAG: UDP-N-acetylglucosamine 1-carboxyvinyltransferase [Oscillospiraceae bacterium]|nr:UDP-N-acetylglucosamine 1-carboxyvinyltransferase [Oscillospiraceae bacterium]